MSVTHISQTGTYNAADVNAVIAQLLALDGSTTMTGTLLQRSLNVLRKAGQTGQEEIWYEYAGDPSALQIVRNAYYSGGWKAKYAWDDDSDFLHPCRILIGNYGKLRFEQAVGSSGGVDSAIWWGIGDINGRQFLSDVNSGTPPFVVSSTTKVDNLNADMVNGRYAGNGSGAVPISNGTVNTNLNADMVDGRHAGNGSGAVPISNGIVNTNLNADMVDGYDAPWGTTVLAQGSTSDQTLPSGLLTPLIYNSELIDPANAYNAATGQFIAPSTGRYRVSADFAALTAFGGRMQFVRDGSMLLKRISDPFDGVRKYIQMAGVVYLSTGNVLTVCVYQNTGSDKYFDRGSGVNGPCQLFIQKMPQ